MNLNTFLRDTLSPRPLEGDAANGQILSLLSGSSPCMIARFGSTEIKAILYPHWPLPVRAFFRERVLGNMATLSGFFPSNPQMIERFSALMIQDMKSLDLLGSWRIEEALLRKHYPKAHRVELQSLEPYFSANPWSQALEGKKVLVVHPFSSTIERQYHEHREFLFPDARVLPRFASLQTVKAVQTIAGQTCEFADWFQALDSMKAAIDASDYDVAILGCGAYGFPLAAHVKRQGKQAIHLGGPTQVLFGIRGKRWDDHPIISGFYNEHWTRPLPEDTPGGARKVEGGCYW